MKRFYFLQVFFTMLLLHGCAGDTGLHGDEGTEEDKAAFSAKLNLVADVMTHSMTPTVINSKNMRYPPAWSAKDKPIAIIVNLENKTEEAINAQEIIDTICNVIRENGDMDVLAGSLDLSDLSPPNVRGALSLSQMTRESDYLMSVLPKIPSLPLKVRKPNFAPVREASLMPVVQAVPMSQADLAESGIWPPVTKPTWWSPVREVPLLPVTEITSSPIESVTLPMTPELTLVSLASSKNKAAAAKIPEAVPVYLIRTTLLPADRASLEDDEPRYQFRLWVVETGSNTIKWAGTQEIGKSEQISFVDEMGRYRNASPETLQPPQNSVQGLTDDIQGAKDSVSAVREVEK